MDCLVGQPGVNFERAAALVAEAARRGSQLVVLPELWSTAYALDEAPSLSSPLASGPDDGGWFGRFAGLAAQHGVWLGGSLLEARDGRYFNTFALYAPDGQLAGAYSKVHLFRLMDEEKYLAPGQDTVTLDLPWGKIGLAICYDLRFPELFRRYALEGARLFLIPAEWPHPRREHWRTLLRARAIENQCFVAACNRIGVTGKHSFFGASSVIDPWGETVVEGGEAEMVLTVTINLALVDDVRQRIPVFADRRPELYQTAADRAAVPV
ncbi:MAG: carbon-nitrogen family hydrolase [Caldilineaceae bacterium]|nr:carbon-nitrogen family hydrolase [Caldilineaceae bacterium]